jgi:hypothetical protein
MIRFFGIWHSTQFGYAYAYRFHVANLFSKVLAEAQSARWARRDKKVIEN